MKRWRREERPRSERTNAKLSSINSLREFELLQRSRVTNGDARSDRGAGPGGAEPAPCMAARRCACAPHRTTRSRLASVDFQGRWVFCLAIGKRCTDAHTHAHKHTHTHTLTHTHINAGHGADRVADLPVQGPQRRAAAHLSGGGRAGFDLDFDPDFDPDLNTSSTTISTRI